ncbi:hypothetical protein Verru16b_01469 [Lacunisphaera limnophila]|uniref:FAD/FMN-containing dehydrogenase n=1 Tax=Lacunisphaera limnophila TaxID=1838286 RepID=A0A1D8AU38_9BACT|nr:hypothetical protein [Lacunisphaera limnophila]AOS44407.1 hypothetical protein Verru16b_01469 [Lacunisphaera limnophila]
MKLHVLLLVLLSAVTLGAAPYRVGDTFEPFTTKDQHDRPYTYEGGARLIVVSFEMGVGKAANGFFEEQPADFLAKQQTVFIANIYGMPGIGRTFALPKMRRYPHRILLADAENFLARYPEQEDKLTVLSLDPAGRITAIRFLNPKKELAGIFAPAK